MHIELPYDAAALAKSNAAAAGFNDVEQYVISLIMRDDGVPVAALTTHSMSNSSSPASIAARRRR